jgi:hypothetical protein
MMIEPSLLTPVALAFGALLGASASMATAVYTQRHQDRYQRAIRELNKREDVYAAFTACASALLIKAHVRDDITLDGDEQKLVGLINRMRLFAPSPVIAAAEDVLKTLIEVSLRPAVEPEQFVRAALSGTPDPDPFRTFSLVCRADLDGLHRTVSSPNISRSFAVAACRAGALTDAACPRGRKIPHRPRFRRRPCHSRDGLPS